MKILIILIKKELMSYFKMPLAYILSAIFSGIVGWIFFNLLAQFVSTMQSLPASMTTQVSLVDAVVLRMSSNINLIFLFFAPLLSMRLIAEEKKQNTIELLYSAPIAEWQLVLAKFMAVWIVCAFMLLSTVIIPLTLAYSGLYETPVLLTSYLANFLSAGIYLAIGLMCSAWSQNQIVASLLAFSLCLGLWMLSWVGAMSENLVLAEIFNFFSPVTHFQAIARGVIGLHKLAYIGFSIAFYLIVTNYSLKARNW
jgi:ABC-2 type transport system permease protein